MNIIRILLTTSSTSVACMGIGAIVTKIIAVNYGPVGLGFYAQIRNICQWLTITFSLNGNNSLIRLVARADSRNEQNNVISTVFAVNIVSSLLAIAVTLAFHSKFFESFGVGEYEKYLVTIIIVALMGMFSGYFLSIINGLKRIYVLSGIQITAAITALICCYPLFTFFEQDGLVYLLSVNFSVVLILSFAYLKFIGAIPGLTRALITSFRKRVLRIHLQHSLTLLLTGIVGSSTPLLLRTIYISYGGSSLGGLYESAWTLCMMYIMLLLSSFGTYYLPTLAPISEPVERSKCVNNFLMLSLPIAVAVIATMIVLRQEVIAILYSKEFTRSGDIVRWMLIGDFFKVTSWVYGMLLLAYSDKSLFLVTEVLFNIIIVIVTYLLIDTTIEAVGMAFLLSNILYLVLVVVVGVVKYKVEIGRTTVTLWCGMLAALIILTAICWDAHRFDLGDFLLLVPVYLVMAAMIRKRLNKLNLT